MKIEWTHKDRQYLKDNYKHMPVKTMAEHLGRSENAIRKQVQYLRKRRWTF
mgnify:FL=1